jgi:hypothetical protein
MSSIPSFKVGSKPTISAEDYQAQADQGSGGSKYLNEPGTYDLMAKSIKWGKPSEKDPIWVNLEVQLEDADGRGIRHYVMVPTSAETNFLYGNKKTVMPFESLQRFLRGFGVVLQFDLAMEQIATLFSDLDVFCGKTIKARVGYDSEYIKYLGKNPEGEKQYQIVKKDATPKVDMVFSDAKAAQAYAKENKIIIGYTRLLEIFPSKEELISVAANGAQSDDNDLPF